MFDVAKLVCSVATTYTKYTNIWYTSTAAKLRRVKGAIGSVLKNVMQLSDREFYAK
jgi:hypothetical protein